MHYWVSHVPETEPLTPTPIREVVGSGVRTVNGAKLPTAVTSDFLSGQAVHKL